MKLSRTKLRKGSVAGFRQAFQPAQAAVDCLIRYRYQCTHPLSVTLTVVSSFWKPRRAQITTHWFQAISWFL